MLSLILRRLAVTLLEMIAESVFLGALFFIVLLPGSDEHMTFSLFFGVLLVSPAPVMLVLYLWGYYFTRPLAGLFVRVMGETWFYGVIAAALFAISMSIAIIRLRPDLGPEAKIATIPFLIGGTAIVYCCALYGDRLLQRWVCAGKLPVEAFPWEAGVLSVWLKDTSEAGR